MVISVTGHRPDKLGGYTPEAQKLVDKFAMKLICKLNPSLVYTGMAQGWDQAIAKACVECEVPFVAAVPFAGQESKWPADSQTRYRKLLAHAQEVLVLFVGGYDPWKMQARNELMVDRGELLVALWNGTSGGTADCVRYAEEQKKEYVNKWRAWEKYRDA